MGKIVTFINEKGGIGKTSLIFDLSWYLAGKRKILLIDLDAQQANLSYFCNIQNKNRRYTALEILQDRCDKEDAVLNVRKNIDIIPGNASLSGMNEGSAKLNPFKKLIRGLADEYDYVFIDVSPSPNWGHILALYSSDYVIIPVNPETTSLEAIKGLKESIETAREGGNKDLKVLGGVMNRYKSNTDLGRQTPEIVSSMLGRMGSEMFKSTIRNAEVMNKAVAEHVGITEFEPKSAVAQDIIDFAKEFEGRVRKNG